MTKPLRTAARASRLLLKMLNHLCPKALLNSYNCNRIDMTARCGYAIVLFYKFLNHTSVGRLTI